MYTIVYIRLSGSVRRAHDFRPHHGAVQKKVTNACKVVDTVLNDGEYDVTRVILTSSEL